MQRKDVLPDLTLIVNAGGESRRMGREKALLPVPPEETPLIEHIIDRLSPLAPDRLIVVTNSPDLPRHIHLPEQTVFVADAYPDAGTLGGIATGLQLTPEWAVVVACDLPLVNADLILHLCQMAAEQADGADRWDVIVPVVNGYEEPLHALYHRRCLPAIETALTQGRRRVISFMDDVRTRYVAEEEIRPLDPGLRSFFNTNTPEDWATALQILAKQ